MRHPTQGPHRGDDTRAEWPVSIKRGAGWCPNLSYRLKSGELNGDVQWVMYVIALSTLLLLTMSTKGPSEFAAFRKTVTNEAGTSIQDVQRIAAWKHQYIIIASTMMPSIFTRELHTLGKVKLNHRSF